MTEIRALEPRDLPRVAALYAEFVGWDPAVDGPRLERFFERLMFDDPFLDPEIPALAFEDPEDGVVGFRAVHPRRFAYGDETIRVASAGTMVVDARHRRRGIARKLVERYFDGPQEMAASDRSGDVVHGVWERLGSALYTGGSIGWARVVAPGGKLARSLTRRLCDREVPPAGALLARLDAPARRRREPEPDSGSVEPLANEALIELLPTLARDFPLRPAYTEEYLAWLFSTMELANVGEQLVRSLVRADDGRPLGAYVMYLTPQATANVVQIVAARDDMGVVLDHLLHDAARRGAVEVEGRLEPYLIAHLRSRSARIEWIERANVQSQDAALVNTVLTGRSLLTRLDGEYWMRPRRPVS